MNQAIHCSCGLVFGNRAQATQHIEYVRDVLHASDAHTVIDETSAGDPGATAATAAPTEEVLDAASFTASARVIRLDALAREAVDAKMEMMRGKLAIETTIVAGEIARARYEAARVKLEQIDKAMDIELAGMIAELGEAKAPKPPREAT